MLGAPFTIAIGHVALALELAEALLELAVEREQLVLLALARGEVADDEQELVLVDAHDAPLEVQVPAAQLEVVLDRLGTAALECPLAERHDRLGHVRRAGRPGRRGP